MMIANGYEGFGALNNNGYLNVQGLMLKAVALLGQGWL